MKWYKKKYWNLLNFLYRKNFWKQKDYMQILDVRNKMRERHKVDENFEIKKWIITRKKTEIRYNKTEFSVLYYIIV